MKARVLTFPLLLLAFTAGLAVSVGGCESLAGFDDIGQLPPLTDNAGSPATQPALQQLQEQAARTASAGVWGLLTHDWVPLIDNGGTLAGYAIAAIAGVWGGLERRWRKRDSKPWRPGEPDRRRGRAAAAPVVTPPLKPAA